MTFWSWRRALSAFHTKVLDYQLYGALERERHNNSSNDTFGIQWGDQFNFWIENALLVFVLFIFSSKVLFCSTSFGGNLTVTVFFIEFSVHWFQIINTVFMMCYISRTSGRPRFYLRYSHEGTEFWNKMYSKYVLFNHHHNLYYHWLWSPLINLYSQRSLVLQAIPKCSSTKHELGDLTHMFEWISIS